MSAPSSRLHCLRQLAAASYDLLAALALLAASGLLAQWLTKGQLFDAHGRLQYALFRPLQYLLIAAYLLLSWRRGGQTLGLRAWRLRLESAQGGPCRWSQLLRRLLALSLPWLLLAALPALSLNRSLCLLVLWWTLAYACGLIDPDRRSIQDRLAGTRLRRLD